MSTFKLDLKGHSQVKDNFFATENPLKMIKNAFYFTLKAVLVLKIFKCISCIFSHIEKRLNYKDKVNFKIYGVVNWLINNCKTHIDQYLKK